MEEVPDDDANAGSREGVRADQDRRLAGLGEAEYLLRPGRAGLVLRARGEDRVLRRLARQRLRLQVAASPPSGPTRAPVGAEASWFAFRRRLQAFVARRVSNSADVEDIVQWVFLQMHRSLTRIRSGERIHAWLYSTARRAIADYYRARSRRREVLSGDALDVEALRPGAQGPTEDDDVRREVASCLAPVVERLAPTDRQAIVLTEIQGLRLADAAAQAGLSLSGMKSRVQRARHRLRKAMLDCCHLALDGRGTPISCAKRDQVSGPCCPKPVS